MASFDRRKCKGPLNGPTATGQHCPEGWTLVAEPLPQMKGVTESGSAEASYYTWVDQFDVLGLGKNTPINTGNASEALLALKDGQWVIMRVPYPLGFYTKWMDGRIDDPNARLEGTRALGDGEHARAVPYGNWKGNDEQSATLSAETYSAVAMTVHPPRPERERPPDQGRPRQGRDVGWRRTDDAEDIKHDQKRGEP